MPSATMTVASMFGRAIDPEILALNSAAPSDSSARSERSAIRPSMVPSIVSPCSVRSPVAVRPRAADRQAGYGDASLGAGRHARSKRGFAGQEPRQHRLTEVEAGRAAVDAQLHALTGERDVAGGGQRQAAAGRLGVDRGRRHVAFAARGDGERRQADRPRRIDGEVRPGRVPGEFRCRRACRSPWRCRRPSRRLRGRERIH